jgi:hypothetical protein
MITLQRALRMAFSVGVFVIGTVGTTACEPDPWHGCPVNRFCVYEDRGWGGSRRTWSTAGTNNSVSDYRGVEWPNTNDVIDNEVSSYVNRSNKVIQLYQAVRCGHDLTTIEPGEMQDNMTGDPNGDVGDNEASSHRTAGSSCDFP